QLDGATLGRERVITAESLGDGTHIPRRGYTRVQPGATRRRAHRVGTGARGYRRISQLCGGGATANREPFAELCQAGAVILDDGVEVDYTTHLGIANVGDAGRVHQMRDRVG